MIRIPLPAIAGVGLGVLSAANAGAQTPVPDSTASTATELVFTAPPATPATVQPSPVPISPPEIAPPEVAPPLPANNPEVFIDRTDYSLGATQPTAAPPVSHAAVAVPEVISPRPATLPDPPPIRAVEVQPIQGEIDQPDRQQPPTPRKQVVSSAPESVVKPEPLYLPLGKISFSQAAPESLPIIFPLTILAPITSVFGWRIHPISGTTRLHTGTDIGAPLGTPVLAAATGRVVLADYTGGYGLAVALAHQRGRQQTLYAHLSEVFVKSGDMVQQGDVIGRVGSTGAATGPHLHFELRKMTPEGWVAVDAGQQLTIAMGQLVQSLKVAQRQASRLSQ